MPCPSAIYLDYNASAPLYPQVIDAIGEHLSHTGNPSSLHQAGTKARECVQEARERILEAFGQKSDGTCSLKTSKETGGGGPFQVIFTSGGTEANALAARLKKDGEVPDYALFSSVEHSSVVGTFSQAFPQHHHAIKVKESGIVDLAHLEELQKAYKGQFGLVSVMAANNETGILQPMEEIAKVVHRAENILHCDASQVPGRVPLEALESMDSITLSGHKMGAPQGIGALLIKEHISIDPLWGGGGQEGFYRPGTENVSAIIAMGLAMEKSQKTLAQMPIISAWRDRMESKLGAMFPSLCVFGAESKRLGNTSCFAIPGVPWESSVIAMDLEQIALSAGSACSSGRMLPSHVLDAMGVSPNLARCALRVSLGWQSCWEDIEHFLKHFAIHVKRVLALKPQTMGTKTMSTQASRAVA